MPCDDDSPLDRPEILTRLFHARPEHGEKGRALYEARPSKAKTILKIPGADHNDILGVGLTEYMREVKVLTEKAAQHRFRDRKA